MDWRPTVLGAVVIIGYGLFRRWRQRNHSVIGTRHVRRPPAAAKTDPIQLLDTPDRPTAFGYKNRWIAVPADDPRRVAEALGLQAPVSANWKSGLAAACASDDPCVFVTPSLRGWVIATGLALPELSDPQQRSEWRALMERLSLTFGQAQYFVTHRVSEYVGWAMCRDGRMRRVFAQAEEPVLVEGEPTEQERDLLAVFFDLSDPGDKPDAYWERQDLRAPGEEDVFEMARRWSLSPIDFANADLPESTGLAGRFSPARRPGR